MLSFGIGWDNWYSFSNVNFKDCTDTKLIIFYEKPINMEWKQLLFILFKLKTIYTVLYSVTNIYSKM